MEKEYSCAEAGKKLSLSKEYYMIFEMLKEILEKLKIIARK